MRRAFRRIEHAGQEKSLHTVVCKIDAMNQLKRCGDYYLNHRIRARFNQWKAMADDEKSKLAKVESVMIHCLSNQLRGYFFYWKSQSMKEATRQYHENEDGPVNTELWNLNCMVKNLEKFITDVDKQPVSVP